jgi:ATP-dependent protease ClpP protease subunit
MRDIPGLTKDIMARAVHLSAKSLQARTAAPGVTPPSASISPAKVVDGVATLRLYNYIDSDGGYWGVSADELAEALDAIDEDITRIDLRINSGGGAVWDGLAILNTLRSHDKPVRAIVDGVAASAASFIAVACDEVVMMANSRMMIHDALGLCIGQAVDMREYADFLDSSSDNIAEIYAVRAGGTTEEWRATMSAKGLMGQWYSAQEAVDAGLADRVEGVSAEPEDKAPKAKATPEPVAETPAPASRNEREARIRQTRNKLAADRHGIPA